VKNCKRKREERRERFTGILYPFRDKIFVEK